MLKHSRTLRLPVRDAVYQLRVWGHEHAPPLLLLHGTRDTSITFQFLVDALREDRYMIAPDWRGHGATESVNRGGWFHDYLADLDVIIASMFPTSVVDLVGHSLGGNLASTYAGLRPERVRHMVALDAFGTLGSSPHGFVENLVHWFRRDELEIPRKKYESRAAMSRALRNANSRLREERSAFLALHSSRPVEGGFEWLFDQRSLRSMPTFHNLEEWIACWRGLRSRCLWLAASDPLPGTTRADPSSFAAVLNHLGHERVVGVDESGHNIHHDQPEVAAAVIELFLAGHEAESILAIRGVSRACQSTVTKA